MKRDSDEPEASGKGERRARSADAKAEGGVDGDDDARRSSRQEKWGAGTMIRGKAAMFDEEEPTTAKVVEMPVRGGFETRQTEMLEAARREMDKQRRTIRRLEKLVMDRPLTRTEREAADDDDSSEASQGDRRTPTGQAVISIEKWNAMTDPRNREARDVLLEVETQRLQAHGDAGSFPTYDPPTREFAEITIEGLEFSGRAAFDRRLRTEARKSASRETPNIIEFSATNASRLQLFLETVVEVINHYEVQPGDWAKVLIFHLQADVRRDALLHRPRLVTIGQVIRYLRATYPVGGALMSLRIMQFRALTQGHRSVSEFYKELRLYQRENPKEFSEREVTRQFAEELHEDLQAEVRRRYDEAPERVTMLELYQQALGAELRKAQKTKAGAETKRSSGSWYGGARGRNHTAQGTDAQVCMVTGLHVLPANVACANCGAIDHAMVNCVKTCGNCRQAGHKVQGCHKPCMHCGKKFHAHRFCTSKPNDSSGGAERRSLQVLLVLLSRLGPQQPLHAVVLVHFEMQGASGPVMCGLDTMAAINVLSRAAKERLQISTGPVRESQVALSGIGDTHSQGSVEVRLRVHSADNWEPAWFELVAELPAPVDCLVSLTWMRAHNTDLKLHEDGVYVHMESGKQRAAAT